MSGDIPRTTTGYYIVEDNRFGEIGFNSTIMRTVAGFIVIDSSVSPLSKYMITICETGEYNLVKYFIHDGPRGGYFYYSVQALRIRNDYFLKFGFLTPESFGNRIRAETVRLARLLGIDRSGKIAAFR